MKQNKIYEDFNVEKVENILTNYSKLDNFDKILGHDYCYYYDYSHNKNQYQHGNTQYVFKRISSFRQETTKNGFLRQDTTKSIEFSPVIYYNDELEVYFYDRDIKTEFHDKYEKINIEAKKELLQVK